MPTSLRRLGDELFSHLPFSVFSTVGGMMLVAILTFLGAPYYAAVKGGLPAAFEDLFHIFHPAHMLFSA
ncbi:MAG: hypothetical protein WBD63_00470, partial [Phycisphaerae bacterium]